MSVTQERPSREKFNFAADMTTIHLAVGEPLRERIDSAARNQNISRSALIRILVKNALDEMDSPKAA